MASSNDYLIYVLDLLRDIRGIHYKKMMGKFLLYKDDILFGGIYDNRFLVKKVNSLNEYGLSEQTPYPGAKPMLLIDIENPHEIASIIDSLIAELKRIKKATLL